MALIKCKNCGHDVSKRAKACPHCGYPVKEEVKSVANRTPTNPPRVINEHAAAANNNHFTNQSNSGNKFVWIIVLAAVAVFALAAAGWYIWNTTATLTENTEASGLSEASKNLNENNDNSEVAVTAMPTPESSDIVEEEKEILGMEVPQATEVADPTADDINRDVDVSIDTRTPTAAVQASPVPIVEEVDDDRIFDVPEESAEFPGDVYAWLHKNMEYPYQCMEEGIQGRVSVQFIINKDGSISDVKVIRSNNELFSTEAERVVKMMPKWKPARQNNKPVRMRYVLPITFRLIK